METRGICALAVALVTLAARPSEGYGQIGVAVGTEYGVGITGRAGTSAAIIEVGAGIAPVFAAGTEQVSINGVLVSDEFFFEAFFPVTLGAKLNLRLRGSDDSDGNRLGLKLGASYNEMLKVGYGGGIDAKVSRRVFVSGGLMYYPEGDVELAREIGERRGFPPNRFDLGPLAEFQLFIGLSAMFF